MNVYVLMTQWKDGDPEVSGVFSSFERAVTYFVRVQFRDAAMPIPELQSEIVRAALKMAHRTDDEDFADFGSMRAWIDGHEVDDGCEAWELPGAGGRDDGE